MSTGIVSSKEGHDESHIDDMKLGIKLWKVVDNVTIGLTQCTDRKVVSTIGVNFFLSFEHWAARQKTWQHD